MSEDLQDNLSLMQRLQLTGKLPVHKGCVNTICWNDSGHLMLSGSDDQHLVICNPFTEQVYESYQSPHRSNIFSARFLPNTGDKQIVSSSADGLICHTILDRPISEFSNIFSCHTGSVYEVITVPNDSHTFLSCGEDGTVRWFDLRISSGCSKRECNDDVMINCRRAVLSLAVHPVVPYQLALGCSDSSVRVLDRRMLGTRATGNYSSRPVKGLLHHFTSPSLSGKNHRITSLQYSSDGLEILVSYSAEQIYLFNFKGGDYDERELSKCVQNTDSMIIDDNPSGFASSASGPSTSVAGTSEANSLTACAGASATVPLDKLKQPPLKRLRLRGDWSDTGPNAIPERERSDQSSTVATSVMQRMSEMLARWLETNNERQQRSQQLSTDDSTTTIDNNVQPAPAEQQSNAAEKIAAGIENNEQQQLRNATNPTTITDTFNANQQQQEGYSEQLPAPTSGVTRENTTTVACDENLSQQTYSTKKSYSLSDESCSNITPTGETSSSEIDVPAADGIHRDSSSEQIACVAETSANNDDAGSAILNPFSSGADDCSDSEGTRLSTLLRDTAAVMRQLPQTGGVLVLSAEYQAAPEGVGRNSHEPGDVMLAAGQSRNDSRASGAEDTGVRDSNEATPRPRHFSTVIVYDEMAATSADTDEESSEEEGSREGGEVAYGGGAAAYQGGWVTGLDQNDRSSDERRRRDNEERLEAGVRQRRVGQSGPSSGDLPLTGGGGPDSDCEEVISTVKDASRLSHTDTFERQMAKLKLQEIYRRRQEERKRDEDYSMRLPKPAVRHVYSGHRNSRTMIKETTFWGEDYVMSGSDCGHIFVLASSGIDYDIKLWMPIAEEPTFDEEVANKLMKRNKIMLEETQGTVTVPATFMLRMLASLTHLRRTAPRQEEAPAE